MFSFFNPPKGRREVVMARCIGLIPRHAAVHKDLGASCADGFGGAHSRSIPSAKSSVKSTVMKI
jgi:hypothetical protein